MRALSLISTGVLLLLLGAVPPAYAQEEKHEQEAKPQKQEEQAKPQKQEQAKPAKEAKQAQAKPEKQEQAKPAKEEKQAQAKPEKQEQAKPAKEEKQAKSEKQEQAKPAKEEKQAKSEKQEQAKSAKQGHVQQVKGQQDQPREQRGQSEQAQGQWAHNGQKDSRGHEYNEARFGREHHARFEENGGRFYNGRREYSYGGYWFYAGVYPPWFYQQDVYFVMGADGLWYAVAYSDPSLTFQVSIE
jgi:hypothetical protein